MSTSYESIKSELESGPPAKSTAKEGVPPAILIVDDSTQILDALSLLLSERYRVSRCKTSRIEDVLASLKDDIKLVLLDVKMAPRDGIEVFKIIRDARPNLPIIFHSAYPGDQDRAQLAATMPHNGFLTKGSYNISTLLNTIQSALR